MMSVTYSVGVVKMGMHITQWKKAAVEKPISFKKSLVVRDVG